MRNAVILYIEAKCVTGKVKPPKKWFNVVTLNIFTYLKYSWKQERKCGECYKLVQLYNGVAEFKQVENKASKQVFRKSILTWCHESCMGTENRLQYDRHIIRFALVDLRHSTTSYKGLMRPISVNPPETKLSKI